MMKQASSLNHYITCLSHFSCWMEINFQRTSMESKSCCLLFIFKNSFRDYCYMFKLTLYSFFFASKSCDLKSRVNKTFPQDFKTKDLCEELTNFSLLVSLTVFVEFTH